MREENYIILEHPVRAAGMQIRAVERVYVCGHENDLDIMMNLAGRIQKTYEADVWISKGREQELGAGEPEAILSRMTLVVFPVTRSLLKAPERIRNMILPAAIEAKVPILPVLAEPGLGNAFTGVFGPMHLMDAGREDFDLQLASYLQQRADLFIDINDEPVSIPDSFGFRIFISYRKKDGVLLRTLINTIRSWSEQLNTAIWYDDELVPGENYHIQISDELHRADMVLLVVTEHLLEEGNYVMVHEYPDAVDAGQFVLPVMMSDTDLNALEEKYPGLSDVIPFEEKDLLRDLLRMIHDRMSPAVEDLDADTLYRLARGYGAGIGTERNDAAAFGAMEMAARKGNIWALISTGKTILSFDKDEENRKEAVARLEDAAEGLYRMTENPSTPEQQAISILPATAKIMELLFPEYHRKEQYQRAWKLAGTARMINDYGQRVGFQSTSMNDGVVSLYHANILTCDGDTELADRYFESAEKPLIAMKESVGNALSRFKLAELYSNWAGNSLQMIKYGQIADMNQLLVIRERLEKSMDLTADLMKVVSLAELANLPFALAKNYRQLILYFSVFAPDYPGLTDMSEIEQTFLMQCGIYQEAQEFLPKEQDDFPADLRYDGSLTKLKEILDRRTVWFEVLGHPADVAEIVSFDGMIPEGVFGDTEDNATASSYKCMACGKRLYRFVFPEGNDPVIPMGPERNFGFSPARIFVCPCGRLYAAPKGRKLSDGSVSSATLVLDRESQLGRMLFDLWWTYLNSISDLYARRSE